MMQKEQTVLAEVPLDVFHFLSFIAIHPLHQQHGFGHYLLAAVNTVLDEPPDSEDRTYKNRKKISKVQLGASFMDMQEKLGVSDFSETYADGENTVRVLYYRTQRKHKDGLTPKDECTYLQFINGKLVETGNGGDYSKVEKVKAN
jgi:hypothetical protein